MALTKSMASFGDATGAAVATNRLFLISVSAVTSRSRRSVAPSAAASSVSVAEVGVPV